MKRLTRRTIAAIALAAVLAIGLFAIRIIYTIGIGLNLWQPLIRPAGVPKSAHHVSSFKDRAWFDCRVDSTRNVDVCRVWDGKGRLMVSGDFRLEDEDRAATASELRPSMARRDGSGKVYMIYLYGPNNILEGRILLPFVNGRRIGVPIVTTNP